MRLLLVLMLGVTACKGGDADDTGLDDTGAPAPTWPDIRVEPTEVDFGPLRVLDTPEDTRVVTVYNDGTAPLHLQGIYLEDPAVPFEVGAVGSVLVPPGASTTFTVTFAPDAAWRHSGNILIASDDPFEAVVELPLFGLARAPALAVTPPEHDFGAPYLGCTLDQPLTLANTGNDLLVIESLETTEAEGFTFDDRADDNGPLPWNLAPGDELEVSVGFAPLTEYSDLHTVAVTSNDPFSPTATAIQTGAGLIFGENTDVFEQPFSPAVDILFAVDLSASMGDDLANVEANLQTFISAIAATGVDYHLAAINNYDGCISGELNNVDNTLPAADQWAQLYDMIYTSGTQGERAFMMWEATLTANNVGSGGCNEGFYRQDAALALVAITDEREQSVNTYSYYVSLFQSMKSDPNDVTIHAVGGDYPQGCNRNDPATGLYEATIATGGQYLSLCSTSFGAPLAGLVGTGSGDLDSFELSDIPIPETIVVVVDNIQVNTGWSYAAFDNALTFEEDHIPEGGSVVEISYALLGDCEQE
ncbi:MAG: choice-of-anchor D domain-containing protein [Alphaproteobacteria bacterium]|nr:choice-of-anchor D domain-containing protein [Alphaproteobacteria bacterium]